VRVIGDILNFRTDFSPFLVHLTKGPTAGTLTSEVDGARLQLGQIISDGKLKQSTKYVSDVRHAKSWDEISGSQEELREYFSAICLTETPLDQIHCLLDIESRQTRLQPYGFVFVKESLAASGVSPVLYVNNTANDRQDVFRALFEMCCPGQTPWMREAAKRLVPLVAVFGNPVANPVRQAPVAQVDFTWEREWRFPFVFGDLAIEPRSVFIGLCQDNYIAQFESEFNTRFPPRNCGLETPAVH
jgi:hypothetical protein